MGISVELTKPPLTGPNKRAAIAWIKAQLESEELASNTSLPACLNGMGLYINGEIRMLQSAYWTANDLLPTADTGSYLLSVGHFRRSNNNPDKPTRLAILAGIVGAAGLWDDAMTKLFTATLGRVILDTYNSCVHGMINAPQPVVKIAFSANRQNAALQYADDNNWYLSSGESVQLDDSWQQFSA